MSAIELNLHLDVRGQANTAAEISQRHNQALALLGFCGHRRHDTLVNGVPERCLVARLDDWASGAIYDLAVQMEQDCIAVLDVATGKGELIGPRVEGYGTFDLSHFHRLTQAPDIPSSKPETPFMSLEQKMAEVLG